MSAGVGSDWTQHTRKRRQHECGEARSSSSICRVKKVSAGLTGVSELNVRSQEIYLKR